MERVMKSSRLLCLCVCWTSFGQLVYVDVFRGLCRFRGGFVVAPAPDSQRVWALSAPTQPRQRTPIWAGGALGEAWLSGWARGRKLKGTCCFDSGFDWWGLATDRYALKKFSALILYLWKVRRHTHTQTAAGADRQCGQVWVSYRQDGESVCVKRTHLYFSGG